MDLAVRIEKKAAAKDNLTIRRARQTRGHANRRASFATLRFAHAGRSPYV